jgi:hypothetical protein
MKQILIALTALTTVACAGSDTDLETAFCDGLEAGAARLVSAAAAADGASDVTDEARVDIDLVLQDGLYGGFVSYRPDETGSFAFGLTADVPFVVRDAAGNEVPIDTTVEGSSQCEALAIRHSLTLDTQTYSIELGPTDVASLGLIAEESDDDG